MVYDLNREAVESIQEINDKIHSGEVAGREMTKLMFEQMLRGLYLTAI